MTVFMSLVVVFYSLLYFTSLLWFPLPLAALELNILFFGPEKMFELLSVGQGAIAAYVK